MELIDKSALVAEIERRNVICKKVALDLRTQENKDYYQGKAEAYKEVLDILDTLEVKEINNAWNNASDFPKAEAGRSILLIEDNGNAELLKSPSAERLFYFRPTNLKMWAYVDELLSITTYSEVKEVDLEKELIEWHKEHFKKDGTFIGVSGFYLTNNSQMDIAKHFFELGLKAQSKDMIEALRTEYEKGRADVIADTLSWLENCWPKYCYNHTIIDAYKEGVVKD